MTKVEFVERFRHTIMGHVVEGVYAGRRDELLAKWMRATMQEMDRLLGQMYEELTPKPEPAKTGTPTKAQHGKAT